MPEILEFAAFSRFGVKFEGNITRGVRNLAFAQKKKRCHFWAFSAHFPVFGAKKGEEKKNALDPGTRVSLVKVLANKFSSAFSGTSPEFSSEKKPSNRPRKQPQPSRVFGLMFGDGPNTVSDSTANNCLPLITLPELVLSEREVLGPQKVRGGL